MAKIAILSCKKVKDYSCIACAKLAMEAGACPIGFEATKALLENKFGVKVVLGTHAY